jgi:hypothetical protein
MNGRTRRLLLVSVLAAGLAEGAIAIATAPTLGAPEPASPAPVLGQRETLSLIAGRVSVRVKSTARFVPLAGTIGVPDESEVDATRGRVAVTVATLQPGQTVTALASQGRFLLHQEASAPAEAHLILSEPLSGCGSVRHLRTATGAQAAAVGRVQAAAVGRAQVASTVRVHTAVAAASHASAKHQSRSRHLWVSDNGGNWGTSGRYVSTTVEGTRWLTADVCNQSEVKVAAGVVIVHDLIRHTSIAVSAGHRYVAAEPSVESRALLPPLGQVLIGVTGGSLSAFQRQVGKHPAVFGYFASWNESVNTPLADARASHARLLLHISTDEGYGSGAREVISPAAIAGGAGDGYLIGLGEELAHSGQPVYIALLPEMNQANNAYSAFNQSGSPRGHSYSTADFRQAWRRSVLILRGGAVANIDRRLRALGLPPVRTSQTTLASPTVSFMWAPQTAGSPDIPANDPAAYYPGSAYVDIVGTDFYSAYPNFAGLTSLYDAYPSKPFGFNEWAMWLNGDPGFVTQFFAFVRNHPRIGLIVYNQGLKSDGPFRLTHFPAAASAIRRQLRSPRFLAHAPA